MRNDREPTHVVHLSSVHRWDDNRIFARHCRSLARHGYDVTLVATGADSPLTLDGVRVITRRRPTSRLRRVLVEVPHVGAQALRLRAQVYHLHDPELAPLIPLLRARGAQVIYDAHEDLPSQLLDKHYLSPTWRTVFSWASRFLCAAIDRLASHIIAATPKIAERFSASKCTVVHNYPELLDDLEAPADYNHREPVIAYVGSISDARGAKEMVDAMELADLPAEWHLKLVGPFSPASLPDELLTREGWERVDRVGEVSRRRAREIMLAARMGLVLFLPTRAHADALPTKLFEYMASGTPVIASDFPLWRQIVDAGGCGLLVDPTDPPAIAAAMSRLAADPELARSMGEKGRAAVTERLNWRHEEEALLQVYRKIEVE